MIVESHEDVIEISGNLRTNAWETIQTALALLLESHPTGVIVDSTEIEHCTPEGAATFKAMLAYVHSVPRARMILAGASTEVRECISQVPGLEEELSMVETVEEARGSIDLVAEEDEFTERQRRAEEDQNATIVAVLSGTVSDASVLEMVQMLHATKVRGPVAVVLAVIVPEDLPLDAPVPKIEAKMRELQAEARNTFKQRKIPHFFTMRRGRETYTQVADFCKQVGAKHVIVGIPGAAGDSAIGRQSLVELLQALDSQIVLVRASLAAPVAAK